MTIVFAANEDVAFLRSGGTTYMTTLAGTFDPLTCRGSIFMQGTKRLEATWDSALSTFWWQGRYYFEDGDSSSHDGEILTFRKGTTEIIRVQMVNADIRFERNDGTWTNIVSTGVTFATLTMERFTIKVVLHASTGSIEAWLGDTKIADFTGDTVGTTGETDADGMVITSTDTAQGSIVTEQYLSEVMVDTLDPRAKRVISLNPTAVGNDTAWVGDHTDVDELELDDSDLISSGTIDQVENYVTENINAAWAEYYAEEVRVTARALRSPGGPQNMQLHLRSNSINYFSATKSLTQSFAPVTAAWTTDPNTAATWTNAAVDALQSGVKSIT